MKKVLKGSLVFCLFGSFVMNVFAQDETEFSVVNVSQANRDAEIVGGRPGDVLRYELLFRSSSQSADNIMPVVDVSRILEATDMIDTGLGEVSGGELVFPAFSQVAPYERSFTFFTRVKKDCGEIKILEALAHGNTTSVDLACGLAGSGPRTEMILVLFLVISGVLVLNFQGQRG